MPVRTSEEVMKSIKEKMHRDLAEMDAQAERNRQAKNLSQELDAKMSLKSNQEAPGKSKKRRDKGKKARNVVKD